ncbi:DUF4231 domain-containing protein [Actinoplanes sp. TFC3]|uniref:DUF4231 domain-containing protein n=1 Tax=Actinoplanes sp. TFC3 TaxID=1710355 RepID=UPI0008358850|nr:DUF4231 domain-containing protein [Actinoplanes sp. TFC3]
MERAESDQKDASRIADDSYSWYRTAAIRSRQRHRASAIGLQVLAAAIPVSAAISPRNAVVPAVLGAAIVVLSGVRSTFNWQENYIRFSAAREAVEALRRLYRIGAAPYDDVATRDEVLASQVTEIEQQEMAGWLKIVANPRQRNTQES